MCAPLVITQCGLSLKWVRLDAMSFQVLFICCRRPSAQLSVCRELKQPVSIYSNTYSLAFFNCRRREFEACFAVFAFFPINFSLLVSTKTQSIHIDILSTPSRSAAGTTPPPTDPVHILHTWAFRTRYFNHSRITPRGVFRYPMSHSCCEPLKR